VTSDLKRRLAEHNRGDSKHTNRFKPWKVLVAIVLEDEEAARSFELFLKLDTGRAFAKKHFRAGL
jgi:predicted GIY-YIG superfamily endonuclease